MAMISIECIKCHEINQLESYMIVVMDRFLMSIGNCARCGQQLVSVDFPEKLERSAEREPNESNTNF